MIIGTLPHADRNNLIPVSDSAEGVTAEALLRTDTQFSFNIHFGTGLVEGTDTVPSTITAIVGLMERPGTAPPYSFLAADCPLAVNWLYDFGTNTVKEVWTTFGVEIVSARRLNIDVGWTRPGPRYTLRLNGADYEGHIDFVKGDPLRCVVPAPAGGFPFPLRLVMGLSAAGAIDFPSVRDVILEGQIGHKALLSAEQKDEWGVVTTDLHFRIYQVGDVPGAPYDIDIGSSLLTGLIAYWKLDEASGTRNDSHGVNHLTDNNTVTSVAGQVNTAAQFTAANSEYLSIADNAALSTGDIDFTICAWVKLDSKSGFRSLVNKGTGAAAGTEYILDYSSASDRFRFMVANDPTLTIVSATSLGSPLVATWYLIVAWHDSVANTINIQVNNGTVDSTAHSAGVQNLTNAFLLGALSLGTSHMDGAIDETQFWKRVLTADERTEVYTNPDWFYEI